MQRIIYLADRFPEESDLVSRLRDFFSRTRQLRSRLEQTRDLNRLQRMRCRRNLLQLEAMERQFYAIDHREDYRQMHRGLRRYLYLDGNDLMLVLGREEIRRFSLFIPT